MARKKKGYQQALNDVSGAALSSKSAMSTKLGVDESIKGRRALSGQNQKILLTNYEINFLKLLVLKTNTTQTEMSQNLNKQIFELSNKLLEGCTLTDIKTDFTSVNISQNDSSQKDQTYQDEYLLQIACFLFLSPTFQVIKKHVLHVLLQLDETRVLLGLEDQLIDFLGDDDFEIRSVDTLSIQELMREFEYKIIVYFEIYHRIVEQNPLESDEQKENKSKYKPQNSLLRLLQLKISFILSRQRHSYLEKKGFVMNHSSTKTLVEFLHSYLNLLNRFGEEIEIELNKEGINFVCEYLVNPRSQRDILTQSSIIFWILFRINFNKIAEEAGKKVSMSEQIRFLVLTMQENVELNSLFQKQTNFENQKLEIGQRGILQMAKIRGFILTQDKSIDVISQLNLKGIELQEIKKQINFPNEESDFFDLVLLNCEKNEGLQKLYAFHTLESVVSRLQTLQSLQEGQTLQRLVRLIIKNLEYPLHSVCSCCEGILKRVLQVGTQGQGKEILQVIMGLNSQQEIRSKYTALNLVITQSNSIQFLTENPYIVREMISLAGESILLGKYLLTFFESVLRKAWDSCTQTNKQELWYDFWIQEYLNVLNSDNEDLRIAVSTHITPIVVKINRLSLALILSKYMQKLKDKIDNNPISSLGVGILEQLLTLLKVARQNKMLRICDETQDVQLEQSVQEALYEIEGETNNNHFSILQSDLLRLVHTQNWKMSLECFQIAAIDIKVAGGAGQIRDNFVEANAGTITKFEYEMANCFLKNCTRTTFPEYRQNFMKAARSFLTRVRATNLKEIKKYVEGQTLIQGELEKLVNFLRQIIVYCTQNLYLDKPIESALPFFEILRMLQELFGDEDYHIRITHVLPKTCLLSKVGILQDKDFIIFLLSCLKSSWVQIRLQAYELLVKMPIKKNDLTSLDEIGDGPDLLGCPVFVNDIILKTALDLINSPKAMIAEGGSLMLKFIFQKCLSSVYFIQNLNYDDSAYGLSKKQLAFCEHWLSLIKERSKIFLQTLIGEGKTVAMLHGLLGFFKNLLLDYNISQVQQKIGQAFTKEENDLFEQWRTFVKEFISVSIDVSKLCSQMLSNNRLDGLDEAQGDTGSVQLEVDCRGHPMVQSDADEGGDYENLILVGVWLSVKENGLAMFNLLKWLEMPGGQQDQTKFLGESDINQLCQNLVQMLFSFKHRGAIEKTAESFSLLCTKLLNSNWKVLQQIPEGLLDEALDRITKEIHSTVLRRSAGIPPTIIAILRAEPLSNEPIFLNKTLNFLIKLGQDSMDHEDKKIHALNIMRFIFQDAFLKHDIAKFITPAMILATENFQSDNWSIRNSALMCFTVLTKRLLGTYMVQEQDLTRKKGLSIYEFVYKFSELSDYFKKVLRNNIETSKDQSKASNKEQQERKDMVVFSILLLISRLVPAFQLIDSSLKSNEIGGEEQEEEENKIDQQQLNLEKSREESIQEFISLIKVYSKSGTYFVRKISAQALLPIISFDDYVVNICQSLKNLTEKMQGKTKLKQNEAHGLMLRTSIFLRAFFAYKDQTQVILGRSIEEQENLRQIDIQKIKTSFNDFYKSLPDDNGTWPLSKVTIALFIKQLRFLAKQPQCLDLDYINQLSKSVQKKLMNLFQVIRDKSDNQLEDNILFKDFIKLSFVLDQQLGCEFISEFTRNHILSENQFIENHIDLCYKVLKTAYSKLKKEIKRNSKPWQDLAIKLSEVQIPWLVEKHDENFCKVLEFSLKLVHRVFKNSVEDLQNKVSCLQPLLKDVIQKFAANCHLTSLFIKISTLFASNQRCIDNLAETGQILLKFAHGEQKEIVRVAAVKSLGKFLKYLQLDGKTGKLKSSHDIWKATILLLNDEHPEVRSYLIQSHGMLQFVNSQIYSINSEALTPSQKNIDQRLVVDINEQMMIEAIFQILGKLADEQLKESGQSDLIQNLLMPTFIEGEGWYRDHISKNFEEKIFNFEPANKYYDLLWIKRIVYKIIIKVKDIKLDQDFQKVESKDFVLMIKENSTEAEEKTNKIINSILNASKESLSLSTSQRAFIFSLYKQ